MEEVVSDLVSAAGEEDKSEKTPIKPEQDQEVDSHKGKQNRKSSDKNSRPSGKNIFMRMWDKIKSFMKKIKNFFIGIQKRLISFKEFVVKVKEIVADTKNQYAVRRQVLGILCMMPFLYQYDFHIFPDFESESYYIRGSYDMKGRIQLIFLLITFIRIVADKDLRCFLKKILDKR